MVTAVTLSRPIFLLSINHYWHKLHFFFRQAYETGTFLLWYRRSFNMSFQLFIFMKQRGICRRGCFLWCNLLGVVYCLYIERDDACRMTRLQSGPFFRLVLPKTNKFRNSVSYLGREEWNSLPSYIRSTKIYEKFKKEIKLLYNHRFFSSISLD